MITEEIARCPVCGSGAGRELGLARDPSFHVPGEFPYRECEGCRSWWLALRPARQEIAKLYPPDYFTHAAAPAVAGAGNGWRAALRSAGLAACYGYPEASRSSWMPAARILGRFRAFRELCGYCVRFLPSVQGGRLLEVGCGNGALLRSFAAFGWQASGIEPDERAAAQARALGLDVTAGSIEEARLDEESYDAIVMHHVIEHCPDPRAALAKLAKALKKGGRIACLSPNPCGLLATRFGMRWRQLDAPRHLSLPSAAGYAAIFRELGLEHRAFGSSRTLYWNLRDSQSLARCARLGEGPGGLASALSAAAARALCAIDPSKGEDIVCIAAKN